MTDLANYIDHTNLKPDAAEEDIRRLIEEAKRYGFASVCIHPCWVRFAAERLNGTDVAVCTVIGFPLGAGTAATKAFESRDAVANGADEVDMVINIGALKSGRYDVVEKDIRAVVEASGQALVKVIIEACLLTDEEKVTACRLAVRAGADYVKTSTGFSTGGATTADVALMRRTVGQSIGVKAAGGIHTRRDAEAMIAAGATRIGASSGVKIVSGS
ncbi:MAG: deoxyribose-phosphate aldolase [Sporolactobacillus sp.]|jgi:deoxyribose-phosphate aldolase|nr:deoxyribose-phosphate aldolase [Sporolactobacillus sp.]MCI1881387.1 deoxyribose-phosphate aldolase [Sporolactobacillus sp.]